MTPLRSLDAPSIARAAAAPLPPRAVWPPLWREVWRERWCIAAEGGARDPAAVADLDLRVAVHRRELGAELHQGAVAGR